MNHDLLSLPAAHPASPAAEGIEGLVINNTNRAAMNPHSSDLADEAVRPTDPIQGARE